MCILHYVFTFVILHNIKYFLRWLYIFLRSLFTSEIRQNLRNVKLRCIDGKIVGGWRITIPHPGSRIYRNFHPQYTSYIYSWEYVLPSSIYLIYALIIPLYYSQYTSLNILRYPNMSLVEKISSATYFL